MGVTPPNAIEFANDQNIVISRMASSMKLVAVLLLVLAPLRLVFGAVDVADHPVAGGLSLVEGLLTGLLGLVLLKGAADARYMVSTKGYTKNHLLNLVESLSVFYRVQTGIAVLVLIVMALRLMF